MFFRQRIPCFFCCVYNVLTFSDLIRIINHKSVIISDAIFLIGPMQGQYDQFHVDRIIAKASPLTYGSRIFQSSISVCGAACDIPSSFQSVLGIVFITMFIRYAVSHNSHKKSFCLLFIKNPSLPYTPPANSQSSTPPGLCGRAGCAIYTDYG